MIDQDLFRFFSGEASQEQEEKILRWLELDPANRAELMRSRKIFDALLLSDQESCEFGARKLRLFPRWAKELARTAAVIALLAGCGYYLFNRHEERLAQLTNTIVVPAGQRVNLTLPDGTNVWLNSLSELHYPSVFSGGERRVELKGEGFFDVMHNAQQPFVVQAEKYDVEVLGTKFDIISFSARDEFSISVIEGRVQVAERNSTNDPVILSMNQEMRKTGKSLIRQDIPDSNIFLWREGLLCFRNVSLDKLFKRFEYSYGVEVVLDTASLPQVEFSGKFRISDGIFHALRVLQRDVSFSYEWDENRNIVYIGKKTTALKSLPMDEK